MRLTLDALSPPVDEREYFWVPLLVLWLGSVARVALAFAHHEVFETEASLALLCTILLPLAAVHASRRRE
jgi:hypothetical protein